MSVFEKKGPTPNYIAREQANAPNFLVVKKGPTPFYKPGKKPQNWAYFFRKKWRKTLKKIVCYDIKYIGKIDENF